MNYKQTLRELYALESPDFKLGLTRMRGLLKKLGNPERKLRYIHVAGSNGKGSVCAFIHSVLSQAGYKAGIYTSPHLRRFNERIKINENEITDQSIARLYKRIKKVKTNESFFEITTALAFLYFFEKKVDCVVLETGLGGRLDATNVIIPLVSVITEISLEHQKQLGNTLEKIAYEKSCIIKKGIPIVTSARARPLTVVAQKAQEMKSLLVTVNSSRIKKHYDRKRMTWEFGYGLHQRIALRKMKGKFQIKNAALALTAIDVLRLKHDIPITESDIINGISNAQWRARLELRKNLLVDCAHNPAGFRALLDELRYINHKKLIMVLGFSNDKDIRAISRLINKAADIVILTEAKNERAAKAAELAHLFENPILIRDSKKALSFAKKKARKNDLIVVAGSVYLVGGALSPRLTIKENLSSRKPTRGKREKLTP